MFDVEHIFFLTSIVFPIILLPIVHIGITIKEDTVAVIISNVKLRTTKEAADAVGRSRDTVLRWIRLKLFLPDVDKDKNGNRVWTDDDIKRLAKIRDDQHTKKIIRGVK